MQLPCSSYLSSDVPLTTHSGSPHKPSLQQLTTNTLPVTNTIGPSNHVKTILPSIQTSGLSQFTENTSTRPSLQRPGKSRSPTHSAPIAAPRSIFGPGRIKAGYQRPPQVIRQPQKPRLASLDQSILSIPIFVSWRLHELTHTVIPASICDSEEAASRRLEIRQRKSTAIIFGKLPCELEAKILDYIPLFIDQLHLAVISLETGHNRIASMVLATWSHKLFGNATLCRRLFANNAFRGEKTHTNRIPVDLQSRAKRTGQDKPSTRTQSMLGLSSGDRTYRDLMVELEDDSLDTFLGTWIVRKGDMKKALQEARDDEEDDRYFAPKGKATNLIKELVDLFNNPKLMPGLCRGCVVINGLGLHYDKRAPRPFCMDCFKTECERNMVNLRTLETSFSISWSSKTRLKAIVLGDGTTYLSKVDADRLCMMQYNGNMLAVAGFQAAGRLNKDLQAKLAHRYRRCLDMSVQAHMQYVETRAAPPQPPLGPQDLTRYHLKPAVMRLFRDQANDTLTDSYEWLRNKFEYMTARYDAAFSRGEHLSIEWMNEVVAEYWHEYLYNNHGITTLPRLSSYAQLVRIDQLESLVPNASCLTALGALCCTLEEADRLCEKIHGCHRDHFYRLSLKQRTDNLSLHFAESACLLYAIHMYSQCANGAIQVCADLMTVLVEKESTCTTAADRFRLFLELSKPFLRDFCLQNLDLDKGDTFTSLADVPMDLIVKGATSLWDSCIIGRCRFDRQITAWASTKVVHVIIATHSIKRLPLPLQVLATAHQAGNFLLRMQAGKAAPHSCGRIEWYDGDEDIR